MHLFDVIQAPLLSEKSHLATVEGKYAFRVHPDANKSQIRRAIETLYSVKVTDVTTMNVMARPRGPGAGRASAPTGRRPS